MISAKWTGCLVQTVHNLLCKCEGLYSNSKPAPTPKIITLLDFKIYFQPVIKLQHDNDRKTDTWINAHKIANKEIHTPMANSLLTKAVRTPIA
jgi:hypothetical protein